MLKTKIPSKKGCLCFEIGANMLSHQKSPVHNVLGKDRHLHRTTDRRTMRLIDRIGLGANAEKISLFILF